MAELPWRCCLLLLLVLLQATARAASLPGLPEVFEVDEEGRWTLGRELPEAFRAAGLRPGWELLAVDGMGLDELGVVQRRVAAGPARLVQLRLLVTEPLPPQEGEAEGAAEVDPAEVIEAPEPGEELAVLVPRAELVYAEVVGELPWPEGFAPLPLLREEPVAWQETFDGQPVLRDGAGDAWRVDPRTGSFARSGPRELFERQIPAVFWSLSEAAWVLDQGELLESGDAAWARQRFRDAVRADPVLGYSGDHLLVPTEAGLEVVAVIFARGTPPLPRCTPGVPDTCLSAGRQILADLGQQPGGRTEGLRQLGLACNQGVHRACFEAVAVEDAALAEAARACTEGSLSACTRVARERYAREPGTPGELVTGLLTYACDREASGSLGERLRRTSDVGAACMDLVAAHDARERADLALLTLDQTCVLGRAEACDQAAARRHQAFAARTVHECEDREPPIAGSCVELGRLLEQESVPTATLDAFDAFMEACRLGDDTGCRHLGEYVDRWGIDNPRVVEAEGQLGRACQAGSQRACVGSAHLLVRHHPRTVPYQKALELFLAACEAGDAGACEAAAVQRRIGRARRVEAPEAVELWEASCALYSPTGCTRLGDHWAASPTEWHQGYAPYTRACDLGHAPACTALGRLVQRDHSRPLPGEQPPAHYLERACSLEDPAGCYWLAELELPRKGEPPEAAYLLLERSCEGPYARACAELADIHLARRTAFDDEIAAAHLDTACSNGGYESCKELSGLYRAGKGVERDLEAADQLVERYRYNARRRHLRLGLQGGLPVGLGPQLEVVLPLSEGPGIALSGDISTVFEAGGPVMILAGEGRPDMPPDLGSWGAALHLYPNTRARGVYALAGYRSVWATGGDLGEERLERASWNGGVGLRSDVGSLFTGVEVALGSYGAVRIEGERLPLLFPTVLLSVGWATL